MSVGGDGTDHAWSWNDDRKQFYYHAFSSSQPDLNLRNPAVRKELKVSKLLQLHSNMTKPIYILVMTGTTLIYIWRNYENPYRVKFLLGLELEYRQ